MEESGTADAAYHQNGAQRKIMSRFTKIEEHNQRQISHARQFGFVYTTPDKELGGYPLQCGRNRWGAVRPTTPLNYRTQGAAMWCMCRGMVRCHNFLEQWNSSQRSLLRLNDYMYERYRAFITLQIHDELVFDLPAKPPVRMPNGSTRPAGNLPVILRLKSLMEQSGDDIGVPLKVDVAFHPKNWSESEKYR
jgi:DNA polymerase I-like protein with 3'-5' exonuclease and polymerase domains